ncbi:transcriptional regulator, HxlR family [Dickeya chrysanthemi Ech1591]|uniref:Transcriptional regulator, HxlR family n=1 Tax=Dickeya chrysanthemi (strain Ech1591) TaxID=561229 RepID=C6CIC1_DICC1|nr:helix-turn-helix domain-containing protein [Dickeya chrysanthemi]ACT06969.1 transcriptional regulator, HxlR family [Dickeya chrysanthemi Ech1591]
MRSNDFGNIACPVADILGVLGDKWTGLLLRDLMLGINRYSDLQKSSNITNATLTDRLKNLEHNGLVRKQLYQTRPDRYEYCLTEQGTDMEWLMLAMAKIGTKWNLSGWKNVPLRFVNKETGMPVRLVLLDEDTGEEINLENVTPIRQVLKGVLKDTDAHP